MPWGSGQDKTAYFGGLKVVPILPQARSWHTCNTRRRGSDGKHGLCALQDLAEQHCCSCCCLL